MFEETACFDPNSISEGADDHGFSQTVAAIPPPPPLMAGSSTNSHTSFEDNIRLSMEELSYRHNPHQEDAAATTGVAAAAGDIALQQQLGFDMENCYNNNNNNHLNSCNTINNNAQLMPDEIHDSNQVMSYEQFNWDASVHEMQGMSSFEHHHHHNQEQQLHLLHEMQQNGHLHPQSFNSSPLPDTPYNNPPTQDLLNLFHLPRCSASSNLLPNSSISFVQKAANFQTSLGFHGDINPTADNASASSVLFDPLYHLNFPPQPPLFRDLFQSLPNGYNLPAPRTASLFGGGVDERERSRGVYQDGDGTQFDNGVLEFTGDMGRMGKGRKRKLTKHFATERQRREHLNGKFKALRDLIPNPTKGDRASIVGEATEYIKELLRTANELKILVEKKRCGRERNKKQKTEEDGAGDVENPNLKAVKEESGEQCYNGSLRSSWLQRKSKDTEVDVRIIDDEVTIKLVQRKKINCLLFVSKTIDELQLDLQHVAGGHIGDFYSFLFNTKICEGSSVYASAIANKLIEVVDRQYAAIPPTS